VYVPGGQSRHTSSTGKAFEDLSCQTPTFPQAAAIFSADVAGYSRLMGQNEVSTVQNLEALKKPSFL
jgi:class 3 adenylate cyclase